MMMMLFAGLVVVLCGLFVINSIGDRKEADFRAMEHYQQIEFRQIF